MSSSTANGYSLEALISAANREKNRQGYQDEALSNLLGSPVQWPSPDQISAEPSSPYSPNSWRSPGQDTSSKGTQTAPAVHQKLPEVKIPPRGDLRKDLQKAHAISPMSPKARNFIIAPRAPPSPIQKAARARGRRRIVEHKKREEEKRKLSARREKNKTRIVRAGASGDGKEFSLDLPPAVTKCGIDEIPSKKAKPKKSKTVPSGSTTNLIYNFKCFKLNADIEFVKTKLKLHRASGTMLKNKHCSTRYVPPAPNRASRNVSPQIEILN